MALPPTDENLAPPPVPRPVSLSESPLEVASPRRFPKWFNWTAGGLIVVCVLGYLVFRERRAAARLIEIRAAIAEYASQVQAVEGKYSTSFATNAPGPNAAKKGQTSRDETDFAADFKNLRMSRDSRELVNFADMPGVIFRFRRVAMHGGPTSYLMMYSRRTPQIEGDDWGDPHILIIGSGASIGHGPWDLAGVATVRSGDSAGAGLVKRFADGDMYGKIRYDGMEDMNGGLCERVTIIIDTEETTFWLDPAHDYLPRRQKLKNLVLDVFEFQQFPDEAGGRARWFPSRGAIHWKDVSDSEYVITELKLNPTLDVARFQIDPASLPDGVKVDNRTKGGSTYTGDREDLWKERDDAHEAGMRILRARSSAQPPAATDNAN